MAQADHRYEVQVILRTGHVVYELVTEAQGKELAARPGFLWGPGVPDDAKPASAIVTLLASQKERGTGFLTVHDPDHRMWVIPNDQNLCFNVLDVTTVSEPPPGRTIGFDFKPADQGVQS